MIQNNPTNFPKKQLGEIPKDWNETKGEKLFPIPKDWVWTQLCDILEKFESGGRPKGGVKNIESGIPSIGGEHLTWDGGFDFTNIRYVPNSFFEKMSKGIILKGDILIVKDGATTGKTSIVREDFAFEKAAVNEHVFLARPFQEFDNLFLFYYLFSTHGQNYIQKNFKGTAQGGINLTFAKNTFIPLPPLPEQQRIVAKIEELFTKLDTGVEALKKIKTQLKCYRQAVLKYAFEGKLTADWRQRMTNDELRMSSEKEDLSKYKIDNLELKDLHELPVGWVWTRVGMISEMIQYGTSEKASKNPIGIPVLRMGNIQDGKLIFDKLKYFSMEWPQLSDFLLEDGDVLFNRTNSAELVGKTTVYKKYHPKAVFASYLIRVRVNNNAYLPDLLASYINSFYGRQYIASVISQQVGQANVNGTKLSLMPLTLPRLLEQHKIVEEIERRFSIADKIEKTVDQQLRQAERLRQSILKKAFEGKLAPQNSNDEPAERLLERIKAEKERVRFRQKTDLNLKTTKAKRR
ncbi:restriction endonuclease subunit S [candidate division WOR-3 bacterium]|nr:restriction endonuclease subunit S [candidate division WOR-3 bacterium]